MHLRRTLPPAAAPIFLQDVLSGLSAVHRGQRELDKLSAELKDYFAVQHCFLVSSGRAALTIILKALKEHCPHKDRVLIPAYTCYSVPSAIVRAGLKLQLCDMQSDTLDFNYVRLSELLNPVNPQLNKLNELNKPNKPKQPNEPNEPKQPKQPNKPNPRHLLLSGLDCRALSRPGARGPPSRP